MQDFSQIRRQHKIFINVIRIGRRSNGTVGIIGINGEIKAKSFTLGFRNSTWILFVWRTSNSSFTISSDIFSFRSQYVDIPLTTVFLRNKKQQHNCRILLSCEEIRIRLPLSHYNKLQWSNLPVSGFHKAVIWKFS